MSVYLRATGPQTRHCDTESKQKTSGVPRVQCVMCSVGCYLVTNLDRQLGPGSLAWTLGRAENEAAEMTKRSCDKSQVLLKPFNQKKKVSICWHLVPCQGPPCSQSHCSVTSQCQHSGHLDSGETLHINNPRTSVQYSVSTQYTVYTA